MELKKKPLSRMRGAAAFQMRISRRPERQLCQEWR